MVEIVTKECAIQCKKWKNKPEQITGYGLTYGKYKLSCMENKIITAVTGHMDREELSTGVVAVREKDLIHACHIRRQKGYSQSSMLEHILNGLMKDNRKITMAKGVGVYEDYTLLKRAVRYVKEGVLELHFGEWVDWGCDNYRGFVANKLDMVMAWKNKYTARIYNILHNSLAHPRGKSKYTLDFFREHLCLSKSYDRNNNMLARVIYPALDEINKSGLLEVERELVKKDGATCKINAIIFHVSDEQYRIRQNQQRVSRLTNNMPYYNGVTDEYDAYLNERNIPVMSVLDLVNKYDTSVEDVMAALVSTEGRESIKRPLEYVAGMLKKGFSVKSLAEAAFKGVKDRSLNIKIETMTRHTCLWALTIARLISDYAMDINIHYRYVERVRELEARLRVLDYAEAI